MLITARIPKDRMKHGVIVWDGADGVHSCRGKADNQKAIEHGNPSRDPRRPWGDHPAGHYIVTGVRPVSEDGWHSYGPVKIDIQPANPTGHDECADRENSEAGDDGILIHGGDPQADGVSLRATYGCLRVGNSTARALALAVKAALSQGEVVEYVCLAE